MAYVSKEKKAKIAAELKRVMPKGWKYTLAVQHYSTIRMTITAAPVDLLSIALHAKPVNLTEYGDINPYYPQNYFEGETLETIKKILAALNTDNYDNSDIQTDYFDVGHYVALRIGKPGKPFQYTGGVTCEMAA